MKVDSRKVLKSLGGISLASVLPVSRKAINEIAGTENSKTIHTDVLVIGGGTAGVIVGIGRELVTDTVRLGDGVLPDFTIPTGRQHPKHQVRLNPGIYTLLAEEKCLEPGVQLRYYETSVKGVYKITHEDYISGRKFDDSVACSFYPIDLHDPKGIVSE